MSAIVVLQRRFRPRRASSQGKGQAGLSLMEVFVAVAILGFVGPAFMIGLQTGSKSLRVADEQTQAEALIRTQIEPIKDAAYQHCDPTPCYATITDIPPRYSITLDVTTKDTPTCDTDANCNTLQEVKVSVLRPDGSGGTRLVRAISFYKVKR